MEKYHKINSLFMRDETTKHKSLMIGNYAQPEFEYLANNSWVMTEKIDGTNIRIKFDGTKRIFGGKTDDAQIYNKLYLYLEETFTVERLQSFFNKEFNQACLYGEGFGAGIAKGGNYLPSPSFCLFDIWIDGWWLTRPDVEKAAKILEIDIAQIVHEGPLSDMIDLCKKGFLSVYNDKYIAEGLVARPKIELLSRKGERIITKLKYKDFALERAAIVQ